MIWRNTYYKNIFQRLDGSQYAGIGAYKTREQAHDLAMLKKPDAVELVYRIKVTPKKPKRESKNDHPN